MENLSSPHPLRHRHHRRLRHRHLRLLPLPRPPHNHRSHQHQTHCPRLPLELQKKNIILVFVKHQGCIQVSDFMGEIPLNISEKGGSVHWKGGIQYKCYARFCQIWGDPPPLFPKFGEQVVNLGGIPPSLALDTTLKNSLLKIIFFLFLTIAIWQLTLWWSQLIVTNFFVGHHLADHLWIVLIQILRLNLHVNQHILRFLLSLRAPWGIIWRDADDRVKLNLYVQHPSKVCPKFCSCTVSFNEGSII